MSIARRAAAAVRPPNDNDRRDDRPLQTPLRDSTYGRRRRPITTKDIPRTRNGARLKDIVTRLKAHRRANPRDFLKCRAR
jgi:hypothetical protein